MSAEQFIKAVSISGLSTAAIAEYRFVKHATAAEGALKFTAAGAGEVPVGISGNAVAAAGAAVGVAVDGVGMLEVNAASANIVAGSVLVSAAAGIGVLSTSGVGYAEALEPAAADGAKIRVLIRPSNAGQRAVAVTSASATTGAVTIANLAGGQAYATNTTAGTAALAIPAAASVPGAQLTVKKLGSAGALTITPAAGTINGTATLATLDAQNDMATFLAIGADWVIIHSAIA